MAGDVETIQNVQSVAGLGGNNQTVYAAYNEELKKQFGEHKANLEEARRLVDKAGKPSKPLTMVYTAGITTESVIATAIVAEAESVGIPMQAVPLQPAAVTNLYLSPAARKKYDLLLSFQLWTDMTDPLEAMAVNTLPGPTNLSQWTLPPAALMVCAVPLGGVAVSAAAEPAWVKVTVEAP